MSSLQGQLVTKTFSYDGGRQVTAYIPPGPPDGVVYAADGGWHTAGWPGLWRPLTRGARWSSVSTGWKTTRVG